MTTTIIKIMSTIGIEDYTNYSNYSNDIMMAYSPNSLDKLNFFDLVKTNLSEESMRSLSEESVINLSETINSNINNTKYISNTSITNSEDSLIFKFDDTENHLNKPMSHFKQKFNSVNDSVNDSINNSLNNSINNLVDYELNNLTDNQNHNQVNFDYGQFCILDT